MPIISKSSVSALIQGRADFLIEGGRTPPYDYQTLKESIIYDELTEEIAALRLMLASEDDFETLFKARCRLRAERNACSALSFTEMPTGVVNSMYWDIAMLLEPASLGDMFNILLPDVTHHIVHDAKVSQDSSSTHAKNLDFSFQKKNTVSLSEAPLVERLGDFAVSGTSLFDLKTITNLRFAWHKNFHAAMSKAYPALAYSIYQHNTVFKTLAERLMLLQGQNQTPLEAINILIRELKLGGTTITGSVLAARDAEDAFAAFMGYIDALPEDIINRLLCLSDGSSITIRHVIDHLRAGKCAETGASYLQRIIDNNRAQSVLNQSPILPQHYIRTIAKDYGSVEPLSAKAMHSSLKLPEIFLEKSLCRLEVNTNNEFFSLLLSIPPTMYTALLKHLRANLLGLITTRTFSIQIQAGILNEEQKIALFLAMISNPQRFNRQIVLGLVVQMDLYFFKTLLGLMPPNERAAAVNCEYLFKPSVLHQTLDNQALFIGILNLLSDGERFEVLKVRSSWMEWDTVLHKAVEYSDLFSAIIHLLPERERVDMFKVTNWKGETVLDYAVSKPALFKIILNILPEGERVQAVKMHDRWGRTVLHNALFDPQPLLAILRSLPEGQRFEVVKVKAKSGKTLLQCVLNTPVLYVDILHLLPECTSLLARISEIERCAVVPADNLLAIGVHEVLLRLMDLDTAGVYEFLDYQLSVMLKAVHSPEIQVLKETIKDYRKKAERWIGGSHYEKLAQTIEDALYKIPLHQREHVLTGPNNPVQELLSTVTFRFQLNPKALDIVKARGLEQSSIGRLSTDPR